MKLEVRNQLKLSTQDLHDKAEFIFAPLLSRECTLQDYLSILSVLFHFHHNFEMEISARNTRSAARDHYIPGRLRAHKVAKDIHQLNHSVSAERMHIGLTNVSDAFCWGALYVVEGSQLGGQVIVKALRENLFKNQSEGLSFFTGDERETGKNWINFLKELENHVLSEAQLAEAKDGARWTFIRLIEFARELSYKPQQR